MNALIAPKFLPRILLAAIVSTYPAAKGAKINPKFHPKIAILKYRKMPYTIIPVPVPNPMQSRDSPKCFKSSSLSLIFILFVFYCGAIGGYKDGIAHGST